MARGNSEHLSDATNTARERTSYKANITASLMLPDVYCKKDDKQYPHHQTNLNFVSLLTNVSTFFYPSATHETVKTTPSHASNPASCVKLRASIDELESERRNTPDKQLADAILEKEVDHNAERIRHHAAMRVDLFFYLAVAVYKTYHLVAKDKTIKQHGKGSKKIGTQACHSSLFANIALTPPEYSWWHVFTAPQKRDLRGTQFFESLNLTVELPDVVNAFDGHLEGRYQPTKYVQQLLSILNQTSMGKMTPHDAMLAFFKVMDIFFGQMEQQFAVKDPLCQATIKVCQYEKEGTFSAANPHTLHLQDEYLYLLLRLSTKETMMAKCSNRFLDHYYLRVQDEIYQAKSVLSDEVIHHDRKSKSKP